MNEKLLHETVTDGMSTERVEPLHNIRTAQHPHAIALVKDTSPPEYYLLHVHETVCKSCGLVQEHTAAYAVHSFHSRLMGATGRHLRPVEYFDFNLNVHTEQIRENFVPACHNCVSSLSLSHLPSAPKPIPLRSVVGAGFSETKKSRVVKPLTIDEL